MMATTELDKIPETVLSRSQVFEFRTIGVKAIAEQLRRIADAEKIADRRRGAAADRARRRRQHARRAERVRSGHRVRRRRRSRPRTSRRCSAWSAAICCSTSPRRSRDEDAPAAFALAGARGRDAATTCGWSAASCRALMRDLLVLSRRSVARRAIRRSPAKASASGCSALAARFSREDLLRAFDLLTRAEHDIRGAAQPRYHLEMALLRWMHLRKLVPLERSDPGPREEARPRRPSARRRRLHRVDGARAAAGQLAKPPAPSIAATVTAVESAAATRRPASAPTSVGNAAGGEQPSRPQPIADRRPQGRVPRRDPQDRRSSSTTRSSRRRSGSTSTADRIVFTFAPQQRALRDAVRAEARLARGARAAGSPAAR